MVVLADDRTGALETAGAIAEAGHSASMVPLERLAGRFGDDRVIVVDLATRHLSAEAATARVGRAATLLRSAGRPVVLKLDSTLRGNWAAEAVELVRHRPRPALVVAAFPAVGRICVGR